ncbi:MAG: hypothetical protein ACE5FJ_06075, partial [Gemmatimonadales bacterium]
MSEQPKGATPRRREYAERKRSGHKDAAERVLYIGAMSAAGGFGVLAGNFYGIGVFAGLLLGLAVGYVVVRFMVGGVAAVFVSPLQPSGKSVPPKRDYSIPQSLAVRGMYAQARNAWEGLVAEEPRDPD